jgi:uncharacterized protein YjbI with pentapeptide repeats
MTAAKLLRSRWTTPPGSDVRARLYSLPLLKDDHEITPDMVFEKLQGLPYRDEVPNGRDFRGLNYGGSYIAFEMCDFSFSTVASFFHCVLDGSLFNESVAERSNFHSSLLQCSFYRAKLRACYFNDSIVRESNFNDARVKDCNFNNADLRGSTFRNADCRGAQFVGANIVGCDFTGANLDEAVFADTILDKSTDFRGAKIEKVNSDDWRDSQGNFLNRGTDLRNATIN